MNWSVYNFLLILKIRGLHGMIFYTHTHTNKKIRWQLIFRVVIKYNCSVGTNFDNFTKIVNNTKNYFFKER